MAPGGTCWCVHFGRLWKEWMMRRTTKTATARCAQWVAASLVAAALADVAWAQQAAPATRPAGNAVAPDDEPTSRPAPAGEVDDAVSAASAGLA